MSELLDMFTKPLELIGEMEIFHHYYNRFYNSLLHNKYLSISTISKYYLFLHIQPRNILVTIDWKCNITIFRSRELFNWTDSKVPLNES